MFESDRMESKKRKLYRSMWGSDLFNFPVEKTMLSSGEKSNNSYTFIGASTTDETICCDRLIALFGIHNEELFRRKFHQACSGDGNELKRISVLHSSSLCSLLFFYNVTEAHPLTLELNGKRIEFTYSRFEFQTPVISNPSNMDVVLVGKEVQSGKNVIFFLESKFAEYGENVGKQLIISDKYLSNTYSGEIYEKKIETLGLNTKEDVENKFMLYSKEKEPCYLEGIKQMISHYIGVNNFIHNMAVTQDEEINKVKANADVYLGEIVFDEGLGQFNLSKTITYFQSYKDKYEKLAAILNSMGSLVNVADELLTYSMFKNMNFIEEQRIKDFYFSYRG